MTVMFAPFQSPGPQYRLLNPLWWVLFVVVGLYRFITKPFPSRCRFHPTCSTYARDALAHYGTLKSIRLIVVRISKCHPFHPGGVDRIEPDIK